MENETLYKTIAKLSNAVIFLSLLVIGLVILMIGLFSFKNSNKGWCGLKDTEPEIFICGNYISPESNLLFDNNCAGCHFINRDMTGPAIQGVEYRMPYEGWFRDFIEKEDSLIKIKEPYTMRLRKKWEISGNWSHNYNSFTAEEWVQLEGLIH